GRLAHLAPEYRGARLQVRWLDVGHQPPHESRPQPVFQCGDGPRVTIAGDDDLPARLIDGIEGMEELLLRLLLASQELDVVNQQHPRPSVLSAEVLHASLFD